MTTMAEIKLAQNRSELATAIGRHRSTVSAWLKDPRWPLSRSGPWVVADVVRLWIERGSQALADQADEVQQERLLSLRLKNARLERENGLHDDLYVDRAAARAEIAAQMVSWRTSMMAEARSAASALDSMGLLADGEVQQVADTLVDRAEAIFGAFADGMEEAV